MTCARNTRCVSGSRGQIEKLAQDAASSHTRLGAMSLLSKQTDLDAAQTVHRAHLGCFDDPDVSPQTQTQ